MMNHGQEVVMIKLGSIVMPILHIQMKVNSKKGKLLNRNFKLSYIHFYFFISFFELKMLRQSKHYSVMKPEYFNEDSQSIGSKQLSQCYLDKNQKELIGMAYNIIEGK